MLNQVFDTLSDRIKIAHAKDVKRRAATRARSTPTSATRTRWNRTRSAASARSSCPRRAWGRSNYDLYLKRLARKHPNIPIIIEHLDEADVPRAKAFLDGRLRANGV